MDTLNAINATYNELGGDVLGIIPSGEAVTGGNQQLESGLIDLLITMRAEARANKNLLRATGFGINSPGWVSRLRMAPMGRSGGWTDW